MVTPATTAYRIPIVETSVAVATPSTTAQRIRNGSNKAGSAIRTARPIAAGRVRGLAGTVSPRTLMNVSNARTAANTTAGMRPAAKRLAIDMPVTEPKVIRTRLGGIVSAIAAEEA